MARIINAPGIEVNEIDRSSYDETVDNSTIGTATLVFGFGDKGDDYQVKWINTMNTFTRNYGMPTNDAERYFYNSVYEILDGGGTCYAAKLPYYNDSWEKLVYTSYSISPQATEISDSYDIVKNKIKTGDNNNSIRDLLFYPKNVSLYWKQASALTNTFESQVQTDLLDYVITKANINSEDQHIIQSYLVSSDSTQTVRKRYVSYIIDNLVRYNGSNIESLEYINSYKNWESIDPQTESFKQQIQTSISSIHDSLLDAYGQNVTFSNIVDDFQSTLYLKDYKHYYQGLSSIFNEKGWDFPSFTNLSCFDTQATELKTVDNSLQTYATISADTPTRNETMTYENYDRFLIKEMRVPLNKIYIVDITRGKYEKDTFGNEIMGIMPIIVSPANALFYQNIINKRDELLSDYNVVSNIRNSYRIVDGNVISESKKPINQEDNKIISQKDNSESNFVGIVDYLGSEDVVTINDYTVSQNVAEHFPTLKFNEGRLDRQYLRQIGIVVFKVYRDSANNNKISFIPVESFIGSLDRFARDETTNDRIFIDDIVNSNSDYINVFSNANIQEQRDENLLGLKNASIYLIRNQTACSMGFYERDTRKNIHVSKSIYQALQKIFEKSEDSNTLDVDLIVDGGVSNIAQFIASTQLYSRDKDDKKTSVFVRDEFQRYGKFDFNDESAYLYKLDAFNQVNVWKKVLQRFDEFSKNVRKDCLFIADGPRPFCIEGNSKIIRRTQPENTIKNSILPKMKYISGVINSSYSTGYLNWFWSLDHSTGEYMWMPPSIKAVGVYLYTDNNGAYWDAPAGLNRGRIKGTLDVAFNPTNEEAGQIYVNSWNYAISYPLDGIILEGQRTFQRDKTALDRVNVRRLMLGLEKNVRNFCKYFNYEGNTEFHRRRMTDTIERYLEQVRANDGISQYIVVCDERNNNAQTIENNELHISIAVRPIKTIEFIVLNFIATNQSVDVDEAIAMELGT